MVEIQYQRVAIAAAIATSKPKIMIPARIAKDFRGQTVAHFDGSRTYRLVAAKQAVPVALLAWLRQDRRYRDWLLDDVHEVNEPEGTGQPDVVVEVVPEAVVEAQAEVEVMLEPETDVDFGEWTEADISNAKLNGADGLKAYADFFEIDLTGATLKNEVQEAVLEWYRANSA